MSHADRFLGRANVYATARPTYPQALGEWLEAEGLLAGPVADIGAGTGLFTRLLLTHGASFPGFRVDAVEPNSEMRQLLEQALAPQIAHGELTVRNGTSEATVLPDNSVSLVTAAQAAHWFAPVPTVQEFRRILNPGGRVLLVWNDWRGVNEPFNRDYGEVVKAFMASDTPESVTRVPDKELAGLMPGGFAHHEFGNPIRLTRKRLHALAGSVSYLPAPSDPAYADLTKALDGVFDSHQQGGEVDFVYVAHAYLGSLD